VVLQAAKQLSISKIDQKRAYLMNTSAPAQWRVVLAFFLDLITSFAVFGYVIALITGGTTEGGFSLEGAPALVAFGLVIAYFVLMPKFAGGRIWQHILRAKPVK
jgi:hypothetical protein